MYDHWIDRPTVPPDAPAPGKRRRRRRKKSGKRHATNSNSSAPPSSAQRRRHNVRALPFVLLGGEWLTERGFSPGAEVRVEAFGDLITLTLLGPPGPSTPASPVSFQSNVQYAEMIDEPRCRCAFCVG
jgi:hypothetical protein